MDLRGRLEMLDQGPPPPRGGGGGGGGNEGPPPPRGGGVKTSPCGLEQVLGGEIRKNLAGRFFFRQQRLPVSLRHGPRLLSDASQIEPALLTQLDPRLADFDITQALYLDTETTGLAGGSGTYAFLIGLAYFENSELVVEQIMMREHCEEKAMLEYLRERVERSSGLVTFNGKTFDAPLLDTRFCLNRLRTRLEDEEHLDLLPVSRRLWSRALPDCRLETLERELLGLPRGEDIPGWLIPQVYFRYLQQQDARGLAVVAEHNRRDMLAMVGLLAGLGGYLRQPFSLENRFRADLAQHEDYALGRFFFRTRQFELAQSLLERSFLSACEGAHLSEGEIHHEGELLARLYVRLGQRERACGVWRTILQHRPKYEGALEGLAKHLEHRDKDFTRALGLADEALALVGLTRGRRVNWQRRRERLLRRLGSVVEESA